jgi:tetratricopeptide (TPR) repeat protein
MYDIIGRKEDALKQLLTASKIEPNNDQVNYYLALIYVEMNDNNSALNAFAKASTASTNPRVFYNYGLLLEQMHRDNEAEKIYKKGLSVAPDDHDLNYVMALFYYHHKRNDEAVPYAIKLMQLMPQNPNYQQLYQVLNQK